LETYILRTCYDPSTVSAVNEFKNIYLPGGNKGSNEGKVGDTIWLYIKREVNLKNLEGPTNPEYLVKRKAEIWDEFYTDYDKLISKPKSSSSTSGNTHDYGKSVSNQGTGKTEQPGWDDKAMSAIKGTPMYKWFLEKNTIWRFSWII